MSVTVMFMQGRRKHLRGRVQSVRGGPLYSIPIYQLKFRAF
jgi:hypothetical protein